MKGLDDLVRDLRLEHARGRKVCNVAADKIEEMDDTIDKLVVALLKIRSLKCQIDNKANSANLSLATDVAYRAIGEWHVTCNIGQPVAEVVEYYARRDAVIWTRKNLGKAIKMIASGMSRAAVARSFNASGTGLKSALKYSERVIKGRKYREECDAQERAAQISNGD